MGVPAKRPPTWQRVHWTPTCAPVEREPRQVVIDGRARPLLGGVAVLAGGGESRGTVVRVRGAIVVVLVAGHALPRRARELAVGMASGARHLGVRAGEREGVGVREARAERPALPRPRRRRVALVALQREAEALVIGVVRGLVVGQMAADALRGEAGVFPRLRRRYGRPRSRGRRAGRAGGSACASGCGTPRAGWSTTPAYGRCRTPGPSRRGARRGGSRCRRSRPRRRPGSGGSRGSRPGRGRRPAGTRCPGDRTAPACGAATSLRRCGRSRNRRRDRRAGSGPPAAPGRSPGAARREAKSVPRRSKKARRFTCALCPAPCRRHGSRCRPSQFHCSA